MSSQIAAQLYTLRDFLRTSEDIAVTLDKVRAIGYEAVQLSGLGPIAADELATLLKNSGLTVAATHVSVDRLQHDLPALLEEHRLWGCKHIAIGGLPGEYRHAEGYVTFAEVANQIGRQLSNEGFTFSYHNHSFELEKFNGKTGLDLFYALADPQLVFAEIDTYWIQHGGGDPAEWIQKVKDRMVIVHFKDMGIHESQQVMKEVGEGNLPWLKIIQACRETGVQWYAVEQDVCQRDPFDSLAISLANLKNFGLI